MAWATRWSSPAGQPGERAGDAGQADAEQRGAAAVHRGGGDGSPVSSATVAARCCCNGCSRRQVARDRPVVGQAGEQHGRVLARAVHRQPTFGLAGPQERPLLLDADRQRRRAGQVRLRSARRWSASPRSVAGAAVNRNARRSPGQVLRPANSTPGPQHAGGLQRFEGRAGEHHLLRLAQGQPDRAVRIEDDDVAGVRRLDHAAALDFDQPHTTGQSDHGC